MWLPIRERIEAVDWWHTIEVASGISTPGGWDLRPVAHRIPWPDLRGRRCLDIGTMDGFWAFEMERRGAAEVVALDLLDRSAHDAPWRSPSRRPQGRRSLAAFELARELRSSRVHFLEASVYTLDPQLHGTFDVVFAGYVLQMLRDPLRALLAIRGVCREHALVLDTVSLPLCILPVPVARLSARRGQVEWFVFNRAGLRRALEVSGFAVTAATGILVDAPGEAVRRTPLPPLRRALHVAGLLGRSAAVRGTVV